MCDFGGDEKIWANERARSLGAEPCHRGTREHPRRTTRRGRVTGGSPGDELWPRAHPELGITWTSSRWWTEGPSGGTQGSRHSARGQTYSSTTSCGTDLLLSIFRLCGCLAQWWRCDSVSFAPKSCTSRRLAPLTTYRLQCCRARLRQCRRCPRTSTHHDLLNFGLKMGGKRSRGF